MKKRLFKKLVAFVLFIGLILQLSSCYSTQYRFLHSTSEIVSIEIVENRYEIEDNIYNDYQNVLASVENIDEFLNEFQSISYKMPLYNGLVLSFGNSELGVKFTYANGDYEVLSSGVYSLDYCADSGYTYALDDVIGFFDTEQYDALVEKYLKKCDDPKFFIMNNAEFIQSIEILDTYMSGSSNEALDIAYSTVCDIEDVERFLDELYALEYNYTLSKEKTGTLITTTEHNFVIQISYINGDYEIFDSDWRNMYVSASELYLYNAYIGEFDKTSFDALLNEYLMQV